MSIYVGNGAPAVMLRETERRALWQAAVSARKRTHVPSDHELNCELSAFCALLALSPPEIHHIIHYGPDAQTQAIACMAYHMATYGIQLIAE